MSNEAKIKIGLLGGRGYGKTVFLTKLISLADNSEDGFLQFDAGSESLQIKNLLLENEGKLPATFMVVAPGSWSDAVWDDILRMRTLNSTQSRRKQEMHVCPLQLDIVERIINRYSNPGDVVLDPFGGIMTVPKVAVDMGRYGIGIELNNGYFRDGVGYLREADDKQDVPTLFDLFGA